MEAMKQYLQSYVAGDAPPTHFPGGSQTSSSSSSQPSTEVVQLRTNVERIAEQVIEITDSQHMDNQHEQ